MIYLPLAAVTDWLPKQFVNDPVWSVIGLGGQILFGGRFILQWIASEYRKESFIPNSFWLISIFGSLTLLIYSIHLRNAVFILGFSLNTLIYFRNLHLIYRKRHAGVGIERR